MAGQKRASRAKGVSALPIVPRMGEQQAHEERMRVCHEREITARIHAVDAQTDMSKAQTDLVKSQIAEGIDRSNSDKAHTINMIAQAFMRVALGVSAFIVATALLAANAS